MKVTISVTKELDDTWASSEEFAEMPDEQIIELVCEDLVALFDDSTIFRVEREQNGQHTQAQYRIVENDILAVEGA